MQGRVGPVRKGKVADESDAFMHTVWGGIGDGTPPRTMMSQVGISFFCFF